MYVEGTVRTDLYHMSRPEQMDQLEPISLILDNFMRGRERHRNVDIGCGRLCLNLSGGKHHQYQSTAMIYQHTQRVLRCDTSMGSVERWEGGQQRDRPR